MNLFRFLAYILILIIVVLLATLVEMIIKLVGGVTLTPEIRQGLVALILTLLLALLILVFLLCLARAKDRLAAKKELYRLAHGEDLAARKKAEQEIAERLARRVPWLQGLCDVLVRRKFPRPCLTLPIDVTRRPDPCIYSQFFLMAQGQPVTWDNPNIEVLLGGVPQDTYNLQPSTNYQIQVGIENASPFFDAIATQVQVNLLSFGTGAPSPSPITSFVRDIPAATPFPGIPQVFNWTSPSTPGHYCIQVLITHPDDVNPANNEGWNNTVVRGVHPGEQVRLAIPVWNARQFAGKQDDARRKEAADIRLALDSYDVPRDQLPTNDLDRLFAPRGALWGATVTPNRLTIPPGTQVPTDVEFAVRVPADAARGTRATFNVTAAAGPQRPLGGVTIHLDVK